MNTKDFTVSILVDQSPREVFDAINQVRGWWTENMEGHSEKLNDEFDVRFGEVHYSKQKLVEVIPQEKVVWLVTESRLNFVEDQHEWDHTRIIFDISKKGNQTQVRFTHQGLVPEIDCYEACSSAWTNYIEQSLYQLITTGEGLAEPKED